MKLLPVTFLNPGIWATNAASCAGASFKTESSPFTVAAAVRPTSIKTNNAVRFGITLSFLRKSSLSEFAASSEYRNA
jgi:hypothetical protein